ncbi:MAG TPA: PEP-CTERM sorting domain-containing protein [Phycisphaerae bacterium]|nr:PEP-CTERM sorting domain-containing protein [Phycisphaerae bacterium]
MRLTAISITVASCIMLMGTAGAWGGILMTEGDVQVLSPPPPDARQNKLEDSQVMFVWEEQSDFILPVDVKVDIVDPGTYNQGSDRVEEIISAGTRVKVYFLHADRPGASGQTLIEYPPSRILFSGIILGIISKPSYLDDSDFLGEPATMYGPTIARGLTLGTGDLKDRITLEGNLQWLDLDHVCATSIRDEIRVITMYEDGPIPEPVTMAVLGLGSAGVLARRRRRSA